jgi:flagellar hook-associated protein 2
MGRIQSSVGLLTGIPIQETVEKLMALEARPRETLAARNKVLGAEQAAITDLTALVLGVQFAIRRLSSATLFSEKTAVSSNSALLAATAATTATPGDYTFAPARLAQTHSVLSSGVASLDEALGGGELSIRLGGQVNTGVSLADLNGGAGVTRGKIRISDRSGESQVIDLRFVQTVDDVLAAINAADEIQVNAATAGDRLVLRDLSGGSENLIVQEVAGGQTAADLGLAGINVAANEAVGQDIVRLFDGLALSELRDGSGLSLRPELPDLSFTFRDGSTLDLDLDPSSTSAPTTLGELIDRLNAADPARLSAAIAADGKRIEVTDLTTGGGSFAVSSPLAGSLAEELGFTDPAVGGTITSARLISGLKTTLLGSLSGGQGLGTLGTVNLTDRSGATASVNLAAAQTLDDVIAAINDAAVGITASYNSARNGISLIDTTGATASNLIVADGDATGAATKLQLAANVAATAINSGSLHRQVISRQTSLSTYNLGKPVSQGSFLITNSAGTSGAVNLTVLKPETVGDVLDAINSLNMGVEARINDSGDGIALIDTSGGSGSFTVADVGSGKAAADLRLAGTGTSTTVDSQPANVIDGSTTLTIELEADETLEDLVAKINEAGGATASTISQSSGSLRHRLSLLSSIGGKVGELLVDGSGLGLTFADLTPAQDAILQVGVSGAGVLLSGTTNVFKNASPGIDVTLKGASSDAVTVTVSQTVDSVATALQTFVDNYNKLRDKLDVYTAFNADAGTKGTLFGSAETLRIDSELSRLVTGRQLFSGPIRSLAELGISINDQGELSLDKSKLQARFDSDPQAVADFFADEETGFAEKADAVLERLVGKDNSLLLNRAETLQRQMDAYAERIEAWDARLEKRRERLFLQFTRLEEMIARIQNNLTAIQQIQFIGPIQTTN